MDTKIAITSNKKGTIIGHAGKCAFYYIYTIDSEGNFKKDSLELEKGKRLHDSLDEEGSENPIFDMNMILTHGIGQGAVEKLAAKSVKAYIIQETDPDTAINKLIEGTLKAYVSDNQHNNGHDHAGCNCTCGGGGHSHN